MTDDTGDGWRNDLRRVLSAWVYILAAAILSVAAWATGAATGYAVILFCLLFLIVVFRQLPVEEAPVMPAPAAEVDEPAPDPLPLILASLDGLDMPIFVLGLEAAAEDDIAARPSHHDGADDHEHDDFDSISVMLGEVESPEAIAARIVTLAEQQDILRVKGYAAVAGKPMRLLVQAVGRRVRTHYDRPWGAGEPRGTRLVVIAEHDRIDPPAIEAVLKG